MLMLRIVTATNSHITILRKTVKSVNNAIVTVDKLRNTRHIHRLTRHTELRGGVPAPTTTKLLTDTTQR